MPLDFMTNNENGSAKLEALRRKEATLKAAIAVEQVKQQKVNGKLQAREYSTVGEALCKYAAQSPEFKTMLRQVLPVAVTDDTARKFLTSRGWL